MISLYGNGFGPTNPAIPSGAVLEAAARVTNSVTITIGGVDAPVEFASLSATGLYQFNVTVPNIGPGDQPVVAHIAGQTTQPGVLLKVQI